MNEKPELSLILEAAILASSKPMNLDQLAKLFPEDERPDGNELRDALVTVSEAYDGRSIELKQIASGYRFQVRQELAPWIGSLWEEKPQRYTRALLETLALIAYRQPITRGEIEEIRGVSVSSNIIRTLQEREWVRVVGHRDVPGRPAMFATTRHFLDYFNLQNLNELPSLAEIRDLEEAAKELENQALAEAISVKVEEGETEEQEVIEERSAQELFEELDAMESDLPEGFDDMIKKQKVGSQQLEESVESPVSTDTVDRSEEVSTDDSSESPSSVIAEDPNETVH